MEELNESKEKAERPDVATDPKIILKNMQKKTVYILTAPRYNIFVS